MMNRITANKSRYGKRSGNRSRQVLWLRVMLSLILMGLLIYAADPEKIRNSLSGFKQTHIVPVFILIALSVLISSIKWKVLLDTQKKKIGLIKLFRIYLTALFFNNFLPSSIGGDGVRIYLAGKKCGSVSSAAVSVAVERAMATISLAILGLAGCFFAEKTSVFAVWLLLSVLMAGIVITLILVAGWTPGFVKKGDGIISSSWLSFSGASDGLRSRPGALIVNLALSLAFQANVAMVVASVIWGMGLPVPAAADMFFITSASSVLAMVPVGINGYGLREGAYVFLLQPYGYSISSALTVSVLFALFVSFFSLFGGLDWMLFRQKFTMTLESTG